jgi:hypothetical protein
MIAFATYVVLAIIYLPRQIPPENNDQEMYLALATEIQQKGGTVGCLRELFSGRFAEANRHPFYPVLLSYVPTYEGGKRLSAVLGGITLLTLTYLTARKWNEFVAGICSVLIATNAAYLFVSTLVACEILVVLSSGLVWLWCLPSRHVDVDGPTDLVVANRAAIFGATFGLMYLIKAHAVLLVGGLLLWLPLRFRSSMAKPRRWFLAGIPFAVAFLVVASPLLVRNVVRFGQPLFNVNGHLLFVDQFVDPVALAESKTVRQAAEEYLRSHTIGQMLSREIKGLAWEAFIIVRSLGPAPWDDGRVLFGAVISLLCLLGMIVEPGGRTDLVIVWGIVLWLFFAWYVPIAAGERFILPILTPVLTYAAIGMLRLIRLAMPNIPQGALVSGIIAASAIWCVATVLLTHVYLEFEMPG